MIENLAFITALVLGAVLLGSACYVYVKNQTFGLGGSCLSGLGVVLVGMSVWQSIDVSFDGNGIKAKLAQVESVAKRAESSASQAQAETRTNGQAVTQLQSTIDVILVQEKLKEAGLYKGASDGLMGAATKATLMRFQASKGLAPTGVVDAATKRALGIPSP